MTSEEYELLSSSLFIFLKVSVIFSLFKSKMFFSSYVLEHAPNSFSVGH
jgi:hypothetical protein